MELNDDNDEYANNIFSLGDKPKGKLFKQYLQFC